MYTEHLIQAGLTEGEAIVYDFLLNRGEKSAGEIIEGTSLKRGNTYNILDSLVIKKLISQGLKNKVAHFKIENPRVLLDYIEQKKSELDIKKNALEVLLPALLSEYQLNTNKPVVSYYEGEVGFAKIIEDTFTSKTEILQYADIEIIERDFKKESDASIKKRGDIGLEKRLLVIDTPFTRELYASLDESAVSHVRAIPKNIDPFLVTMYIYDCKVSYLSLVKEKIIGVIIEDKNIYYMHKHLFDTLYAVSPSIKS